MFQVCQFLLRNFSTVNNLRKIASITSKSLGSSSQMHNAGLIIIGDEILKAQVRDTNSYFMCTLLYECGVKVEKISVIRDDVDIIANEISEFSGKYKYVITSGGIGPTHDDMTFEGLAKAFNDSLYYHPTLMDIVKELYKTTDNNSPGLKVANIPKKASLKFGKDIKTGDILKFPCINIENVYVFPGSPMYLEGLFQSLCKELFKAPRTFVQKDLYINSKEELFADALTKVSEEFPNVAFGSYPVTDQSYYKARVTIESDNEEVTSKAEDRFRNLLNHEIFVNYDKSPEKDAARKFDTFIEGCKYRELYLETFEKLRDIYQGSNEIAFVYDWSMESTVLLHLVHIIAQRSNNKSQIIPIIFKHEEWNPEAENFIKEISKRYNLQIETLAVSLPEGLEKLGTLYPDLKILLLNRKFENKGIGICDTFRGQTKYPIDIKCPLIGWTSDSLWTFARSLSLPYCSLCEEGFTGTGGRYTTKPNPELITKDDKGTYHPA